MAFNFDTLIASYKKKLTDVFTPKLTSPLPQQKVSQPSLGTRAMVSLGQSPIGKGIVSLQKNIENRTLPKVNLQPYTEKIQAPIPRFGAQLGAGIVENFLNIPQRTLEGAGRAGIDIRTAMSGGKLTPARVIGTAASVAEPLIDIATLGGGTVVKNAGKQAIKEVAKQTLKQTIKKGALKGAAYGAAYGGLHGLTLDDEANIKNFVTNLGVGALLGGGVGGLTSAIGGLRGMTKRTPEVDIQLRERNGRYAKGDIPIKPNGMPKPQWEFQLKFNQKYGRNPYEPVYGKDLAKAIEMEAQDRVGLQVKPIGGVKAISEAEKLSQPKGVGVTGGGVSTNKFEITSPTGGRAFGTINGDTANVVNINAGGRKGTHFFEQTINDLYNKGVKTINVKLQNEDSMGAIKSMLDKGILTNPRNKMGSSGNEYYSTFDIGVKGQPQVNEAIPLKNQSINTQLKGTKLVSTNPLLSESQPIIPPKKINIGGTGVIPEEKLNQFEVSKSQSELAQAQRGLYSKSDIQNINVVKKMAQARDIQAGNVETLRAKNPSLVSKVLERIQEVDPTVKSDDEAFQQLLQIPNKSQTKSPILPKESFGLGDNVYNAQATPKTLENIKIKDQKIEDRNFKEWSNMIYKNTVKQEKLNTEKNIKIVTQKMQEATDKALAEKYAISKTGKILTDKSGTPLPKEVVLKADNWKDKPKISYGRETIERNFEDTMGKDAPEMIKTYVAPIKASEANRIRWLNKERGEIKSLGINPGSKESKYVQLLGEGKTNANEIIRDIGEAKYKKVQEAVTFFRNKYDTYLKDINAVLVKNGYDPIPKRADYFTHFQEITSVLERFGIPIRDNKLPTDINGLTADFRPGKNFFSSALPRLGEKTDIDAIKGIDRYLEGASNQIFHTDNIQRLRLLDKALREKYAGTQHLSNFVSDLTEYTNSLAGKKSMIDRAAEIVVGRNIYGATNRLKKQVGSNMVGGNISSALTNYIPLTQSLATTDKPSFVKGMMATIADTFKNDGFIDRSDFLTKRIGSDRLAINLWDKIGDKAGWLFKTIDRFTAGTIVRSKYFEGVKKGMSPAQAMDYADNWANRIMAGRAKGDMPTLFNSQTLGALTQFQIEVNNQLSFMFKDIPRNFNVTGAASALGQVFLYSYIFNELFEKATGRRPAFDPIGVIQDAYEDFTNPNMKKGKAVQNTIQNVSNQFPFTSALTGGRIPMGAALPDIMGIATGKAKWQDEIKKPLFYIAPPTSGGQIKKTIEGIQGYQKGYTESPSGAVKFPIEQTPQNAVRTSLFGANATPEATKYYREGENVLGKNQSALFKIANPEERKGVYQKIMDNRETNNTIDAIKEGVNQGKEVKSDIAQKATFKINGEDVEGYVIGNKFIYQDQETGEAATKLITAIKKAELTNNLSKYQSYGGFTKPKKITIKKVTVPKIKTSKATSTVKKITIKAPRYRKIKRYQISVQTVKKPKITTPKLAKWEAKVSKKYTRVKKYA